MMHEITITFDDREKTTEITGDLNGIPTLDLACALTQLIRLLDRHCKGKLIELMIAAAEAMKSEE